MREERAAITRKAQAGAPHHFDESANAAVIVPAAVPVSVIVDGRLVAASHAAVLERGVVMAPLDPYVRTFAARIVNERAGRIVVERPGYVLVFHVGTAVAEAGRASAQLPIAPYLRAGYAYIPLAAVGRLLGATVTYRAHFHALDLRFPAAQPLVTAPAYVAPQTAVSPGPTFAPTSTPQPVETLRGIPKPRRTPLEAGPADPARSFRQVCAARGKTA